MDAIKVGWNPEWEISHKQRVKIRPVRMHEIGRVASIERQCFPDAWNAMELRKFRRCWNTYLWVAVVGAKVVGHIMISEGERSLNVVGVAVDPKYQRMGIGRQLMDEAGELLCKRRKRLVTHIRETNLIGQLFLRQLGFTVTKVLRDVYQQADGELCIRMSIRKVIDEPETFED